MTWGQHPSLNPPDRETWPCGTSPLGRFHTSRCRLDEQRQRWRASHYLAAVSRPVQGPRPSIASVSAFQLLYCVNINHRFLSPRNGISSRTTIGVWSDALQGPTCAVPPKVTALEATRNIRQSRLHVDRDRDKHVNERPSLTLQNRAEDAANHRMRHQFQSTTELLGAERRTPKYANLRTWQKQSTGSSVTQWRCCHHCCFQRSRWPHLPRLRREPPR
mmetsp:Transcript_15780/g.39819  ORF Transcript_15780/g.39819 Transcript_15780/m.39819 type:complete len:218 (+) Transcript_15780:343-996(+)